MITQRQRYLKDKKVTILKMVETNVNGEAETNYIPLEGAENIWAYYRHVSGSEFFASGTVNAKIEVIFVINWRSDIDTYMKIIYKGKEYGITQIDDFEGQKTDLKIFAYSIN